MPASSATTVAQRIAQALPQLTRSHRQVADYVLERPLQVATLPIDELATAAGVSVATANRFARALGFDGYANFRAELVRGFEPLLAPVERLRGSLAQPSTVAEVFAAALEESRGNIEATRQALDPASCEAAVARILDGAHHLHRRLRRQRLAVRAAAARPGHLLRRRAPAAVGERRHARRARAVARRAARPAGGAELPALPDRHRGADRHRPRARAWACWP